MIRLTNEGHKMGDALEAARKDTVIKERHFITPTSLAALVVAQRRDDRNRSPRGGQQGGGWHGRDWHGDWHRGKHGGYGKGKGSKGKQSGKKGNLHNKTPDGREICWKWNSQHERCRFNCGRVHQCQICLGSHPMHACPQGKQKGPPKDTAGGGKNEWPAVEPGYASAPARTKQGGNEMTFTILYLFSGRHRDTSFAVQMKELGRSRGVTVSVEEVDIEFGASFDLSVQEIRQHYLSKIQRGDYDAVVCTPPCSTYSRVRMANMRGPPPLRSREFPFGFPWLSNKHKKEAELGTMLVDYTLEVAEMVATVKVSKKGLVIRFFSEHPEHLGAVIREEDKWRLVPASMWQRQEWSEILQQMQGFTVVFNQCCWGASYRKPTRVASNASKIAGWGSNQWPSFDEDWHYVGPLAGVNAWYPRHWWRRTTASPSPQQARVNIRLLWIKH